MKMLKPIVDTINEIRNEYPIIGNELDGKIYYMNGNDGTDFDWNCNGRTCEFMVFHENEMGYIKLDINKEDVKITVFKASEVCEWYDKYGCNDNHITTLFRKIIQENYREAWRLIKAFSTTESTKW